MFSRIKDFFRQFVGNNVATESATPAAKLAPFIELGMTDLSGSMMPMPPAAVRKAEKVLYRTRRGNLRVARKVRQACGGWYLRRPGHAGVFFRSMAEIRPRG